MSKHDSTRAKREALLQTQRVILDKDPRITVWDRQDDSADMSAGLLDAHFDAVLIADSSGRIVESNYRAEELLGYSADELKNINLIEVIDKADQALINKFNELVDNHHYVLVEGYCLCRDQSVFPAEIALGVKRLEEYDDSLVLFIRDIEERKQIESRLDTIYRALQNAAIGIVTATIDGTIDTVNPAFLDTWGLDRDYKAAGRDVASFFCDPDEIKDILGKVKESYICMHETLGLRQDGSTFPAQISVAPDTEGADNKPRGFVISCKDNTATAEADELRRRAEQKQIENDRIKARLDAISSLSFSINAPLQTLLSIAEDEDRKDIRTQVDRIIKLVENLRKQEGSRDFDIADVSAAAESGACEKGRALIIDDEDIITQYFSKFINTFYPHIEIDIANSGSDGLNIFSEKHHGLVILDCVMPEMSGRETYRGLETICEKKRWDMPNVVFNTGFLPDDSIRQLVKINPRNTLLQKPIKRDDLLAAIGPHLKK